MMETSSPADSQGATMLAYFSHWLKQVERGKNSFIKVERGENSAILDQKFHRSLRQGPGLRRCKPLPTPSGWPWPPPCLSHICCPPLSCLWPTTPLTATSAASFSRRRLEDGGCLVFSQGSSRKQILNTLLMTGSCWQHSTQSGISGSCWS